MRKKNRLISEGGHQLRPERVLRNGRVRTSSTDKRVDDQFPYEGSVFLKSRPTRFVICECSAHFLPYVPAAL